MDIETRNGSLRILQAIGILFTLTIFVAHAEEGFYLEKLIKRYATLEAYCDKGTITEQRDPTEKSKPTERNKFERCYRSDGFYKKIDFYGNYQKTRKIYWADGVKTYYANSFTKNESLKTSIFFDRPVRPRKRNAEYDLPDHVLGQLLITVLVGSRDGLGLHLKLYEENNELSNNEYTVVEYKRKIGDDPTIDTIRIWISNKDYVVTKAERLWGSVRLLLIEITEYQINPTLTKEDLWHEPPLLMWYSLHRRPDVFIPVLLSLSYFVGFLFWSIVFSRGRRIKDGAIWWPNKVRMWKIYFKFVLISTGVFIVLFLLSSLVDGYPWAILFLRVYGAIYGLGMIAIGCFLLSAHLAYWVAKMRISKAIS